MERTIEAVTHPRPEPPRARGTMRNRILLHPDRAEHADPFVALVEDWVTAPGGFPEHPHRGFETVTLVLAGALEHRDSRGHVGRLGPGEVQWMTAGQGVLHSEMPIGSDTLHMLQLWLNLPGRLKGVEPRYQQVARMDPPILSFGDSEVRVIAGRQGAVEGPVRTWGPTSMLDANLRPGDRVPLQVPSAMNALAVVLAGEVRFGHGAIVEAGSVVHLASDGDESTLVSESPARVVLYAGEPWREPIAAAGPFVMNTEAELAQAFDDYRRGTLAR